MADRTVAELRRLIDHLTLVQSEAEEEAVLAALLRFERTQTLSFLNQNALNLARENAAFHDDLTRADWLLRDGVGIEVALRVFGHDPGRNANGTDIIPRLLARAGSRRIALLGTREPWLTAAADAVEALGPEVVEVCDGFRSETEYSEMVARTDPDIVLLGMGMPRQEHVARQLALSAGRPRLFINGGAVLDFLGGRFARAPLWLRSARLEWAFRLAQEPRRLTGRYVNGGGRFALTVARLRNGQPGAFP